MNLNPSFYLAFLWLCKDYMQMILRFLFFYLDLLKHCKALSTEKCRRYMNIFIYLFIIIIIVIIIIIIIIILEIK